MDNKAKVNNDRQILLKDVEHILLECSITSPKNSNNVVYCM